MALRALVTYSQRVTWTVFAILAMFFLIQGAPIVSIFKFFSLKLTSSLQLASSLVSSTTACLAALLWVPMMIRILNISLGKNDEEEEEEGDINDNQQVIDHETHKSFKSGQPPSLWAAPFSLINLFCLLSPPHLFIDTQYNSSNQEILICNQVCSRELLEISRRTHSHTCWSLLLVRQVGR